MPRDKKKSTGSRVLSFHAPFLWNNLPADIRQSDTTETFKSRLKTFNHCYILNKFSLYSVTDTCLGVGLSLNVLLPKTQQSCTFLTKTLHLSNSSVIRFPQTASCVCLSPLISQDLLCWTIRCLGISPSPSCRDLMQILDLDRCPLGPHYGSSITMFYNRHKSMFL